MATKLRNVLRNSISAEKKNVNARATNSFVPTARKKSSATKTTKVVVKNVARAGTRKEKSGKVKVLKSVAKASANKHTNLENQHDQYVPTQLQVKVGRNIGDSLKNMVTVGYQLNYNCIDALKIVNDDLKEYLESLPVAVNMADLIRLNLEYIFLLRKRRSSVIADNVRTFFTYYPRQFFNN